MTEVKYNIGGGKEIIAEYDDDGIMEITRECFEMLIEKQIPKKPFITKFGNGAEIINCGKCYMCSHITRTVDYCPNCGQRIDWGE